MIDPIIYQDGILRLLDQRRLPTQRVYLECRDYQQVARAIRDMVVRGAPAIGITAALGVCLGAQELPEEDPAFFLQQLQEIIGLMRSTRPTAINLSWALDRMEEICKDEEGLSPPLIKERLWQEALKIWQEEKQINEAIAHWGAGLIKKGDKILTYCNTGTLATGGGLGTALGIIKQAYREGKDPLVMVSETRPYLQGARLTAWELKEEGVPHRLITDNMAGFLMQRGKIDLVLVGADRIALNGDVANKIGTYSLAVLARENQVPFYVAAPTSTVDVRIATGKDIPLEERPAQEVTHLLEQQIAPPGTEAINLAFDITPHHYITAFITEKGIILPSQLRLKLGPQNIN